MRGNVGARGTTEGYLKHYGATIDRGHVVALIHSNLARSHNSGTNSYNAHLYEMVTNKDLATAITTEQHDRMGSIAGDS